jgi:hypothetical protein
MSLFQYGNFVTHSGLTLDWKIDCDCLSDEDIYTIAMASHALLERIGYPASKFIGIPSGGVRLANKLQGLFGKNDDSPPLIVDDVLTTGKSMKEVMSQYPGSKGLVIFARAPVPIDVAYLFSCNWFATHSDMKPVLDNW